MPEQDLVSLLLRARTVLERFLWERDGERIRDDVAEVCMAIDDALPEPEMVPARTAELERSAA
jgi:hypothetical protein